MRERKEERRRGGAGLDRHRHEHIFQLQIIRFPQVADVLKQTTHTQIHTQVQVHLVTDANSGTHAETQTV